MRWLLILVLLGGCAVKHPGKRVVAVIEPKCITKIEPTGDCLQYDDGSVECGKFRITHVCYKVVK